LREKGAYKQREPTLSSAGRWRKEDPLGWRGSKETTDLLSKGDIGENTKSRVRESRLARKQPDSVLRLIMVCAFSLTARAKAAGRPKYAREGGRRERSRGGRKEKLKSDRQGY